MPREMRTGAVVVVRRGRAAGVAGAVVLGLLVGIAGVGLTGAGPAGASVLTVFDGSTQGFVASPAIVAPTPFELSPAPGTVVAGGAWLFWSAPAAHSTLTLDGPDTDTDGAGADTDADLLTFTSDAELALAGSRTVFSAPLPATFPTTTDFSSDLSAGDQIAAVAVITDGTSPRTFFHLERDLRAISAGGTSSDFVGLPKPTVTTGTALYGVIEAAGIPTVGSSSFHSPAAGTAQTFTAGTGPVDAGEVPVTLDPAATTARVVLAGDADHSFVGLYTGVAYAAPAPAPTATARFVGTGTSTDVTNRNPGQSFDVLVSFENASGAGPLENLSATIPLPTSTTQSGSITEEGATSAGSFTGTGPVGITVPELSGGETYTVRMPVVVDHVAGAGSTTEVSLAAQTVTYDDPSGSSGLTTTTTADSVDVNPSADLTAHLTAESGTVVLSGGSATIGYLLTLTNNGPDPATAATYSLTKPAGTDGYVFSGSGLACSDVDATSVRCSLADALASGATSGAATIRATATTTGTKTTFADRVSSTPTDPIPGNDDSAAASVDVQAVSSSVNLTGSAPASVTLGGGAGHDPYPASFTVANSGPDATEGAALSISVPAGTAITTSGCAVDAVAVNSGPITCGLGVIDAGDTKTVNLTIDPSTAGEVSITGTYSQTNDGSATPGSLTLSTTVRAVADVRVSVGATPSPVKNGDVLTYTVAVANNGPSAATGVQVTLALSPSVTFESLTVPSGWTCNAPSRGTTGTVVCDRSSFTSGAVSNLLVKATVGATAKSSVSSTAGVSSTSHDPTNANNTATVATPVKGGKK